MKNTRMAFRRILVPCQHGFLPVLDGYLCFKKKKTMVSIFKSISTSKNCVALNIFLRKNKGIKEGWVS
jgi:hypothetical protein